MDLTWLACDLKSGLILGELPLDADKVRKMIAREETATWQLPVHDLSCPDDWHDITTPGRRMLVLCLDDVPVQGWPITSRNIGSSGVTLGGVTLEHVFARTNVIDMEGEADEVAIIWFVIITALSRFGFDFEYTETGVMGYADYSAAEDQSCLAILNDRAALANAPEWRIALSRDGNRIAKTFEIRPRIGQDRPDAVFELDDRGTGNIASYNRFEDYGPNAGATHVIGVSDGSGAYRPMTHPHISDLVGDGWPEWESRVSFPNVVADSVDDEDAELERLASNTLKQRERGTTTWSIVGDENAPRPGRDFGEGDTVYVDIAPRGKEDPTGGSTAMRVLGWDLDPRSGRVTLIAWEDPES